MKNILKKMVHAAMMRLVTTFITNYREAKHAAWMEVIYTRVSVRVGDCCEHLRHQVIGSTHHNLNRAHDVEVLEQDKAKVESLMSGDPLLIKYK